MPMNISDILNRIPHVTRKANGEHQMPCPFCADYEVVSHTAHGIKYSGEDRMILFNDHKRFFCRSCQDNNRGTGGNGSHSILEVALKIGLKESDVDLDDIPEGFEEIEDKPLSMLWTEQKVASAHEKVDYSYWGKFGWSKQLVDTFKLGKGTIYSRNPNVHVIPMRVTRTSDFDNHNPVIEKLYYMSSRGVGGDGKPVKERSAGSSKKYIWLIEDDHTSSTIYITEGEKDGISAYLLGKNVAVSFGVNHWSKDQSRLLFSKGYREAVVLGDRDEKGNSFTNRVAGWCADVGLKTKQIDWSRILDKEQGLEYVGDITDLLSIVGQNQFIELIKDSLIDIKIDTTGGVTKPRVFDIDPSSIPEFSSDDMLTVEQIRSHDVGGIPYAIRDYFERYDKDHEESTYGGILSLNVGAGAGKTYSLIREMESQAKDYVAMRKREHDELKETVEQERQCFKELDKTFIGQNEYNEKEKELQRIEKKLEDFSYTHTAWFGPFTDGFDNLINTGADPKLWYNYRARDEENCQNLDMVHELGRTNNDIGTYCRVACPFKKMCQKSGYLSQERDKHKKPLTYYRHPHLRGSFLQGYKSVVVDEYAGKVFEDTYIVARESDLSPSNDAWESDMDTREAVDAINTLTKAIRVVFAANKFTPSELPDGSNNPSYFKEGSEVIDLLIDAIHATSHGNWTLATILNTVDNEVAESYQPTYLGEVKETLPNRVIPQLIRVLRSEYDLWKEGHRNYPSRLHLISDTLEVYDVEAIKVMKKVPVVVSDATAVPELYRAMFNRDVITYNPKFKNPNAKVIVVYGSDWTNTYLKKNLGKIFKSMRNKPTDNVVLADGTGVTEITSDIPIGLDNPVIQRAQRIVDNIIKNHDSLLVITHKNMRELLESLYTASNSNKASPLSGVAWGHYGSLRGSNAYQDYEAVILIGAFRIPYDVIRRRVSVWSNLLGDLEPIPKETVIKDALYDGREIGHGYRTFDHPLAMKYTDMVEAGEMVQSAYRIRPHSSQKQKTVYVFASRPAIPYVDEVVHINGFLSDTQHHQEALKELKEEYEATGKFPTYKHITDKYRISKSTVKELREKIMKEGDDVK